MDVDRLNKIEHGTRGVSGTELHAIARAIGVRPEYLLRDPIAHFRGDRNKPGAEHTLATFDRFIDNWLTAQALVRVDEHSA